MCASRARASSSSRAARAPWAWMTERFDPRPGRLQTARQRDGAALDGEGATLAPGRARPRGAEPGQAPALVEPDLPLEPAVLHDTDARQELQQEPARHVGEPAVVRLPRPQHALRAAYLGRVLAERERPIEGHRLSRRHGDGRQGQQEPQYDRLLHGAKYGDIRSSWPPIRLEDPLSISPASAHAGKLDDEHVSNLKTRVTLRRGREAIHRSRLASRARPVAARARLEEGAAPARAEGPRRIGPSPAIDCTATSSNAPAGPAGRSQATGEVAVDFSRPWCPRRRTRATGCTRPGRRRPASSRRCSDRG